MQESTELNQPMPEVKPKDDIRPKKKMSKGKIVGWVIVLIIIWLVAIQIMAAERYDMQVQVKEEENILGINPTEVSLDFGDLSRNVGATRFVAMKNESDTDRYIMVWKMGEISGMVDLNQNNFTLESGEEFRLEFNIQIPPSAEPRLYTGKTIIFKWPKFF